MFISTYERKNTQITSALENFSPTISTTPNPHRLSQKIGIPITYGQNTPGEQVTFSCDIEILVG